MDEWYGRKKYSPHTFCNHRTNFKKVLAGYGFIMPKNAK